MLSQLLNLNTVNKKKIFLLLIIYLIHNKTYSNIVITNNNPSSGAFATIPSFDPNAPGTITVNTNSNNTASSTINLGLTNQPQIVITNTPEPTNAITLHPVVVGGASTSVQSPIVVPSLLPPVASTPSPIQPTSVSTPAPSASSSTQSPIIVTTPPPTIQTLAEPARTLPSPTASIIVTPPSQPAPIPAQVTPTIATTNLAEATNQELASKIMAALPAVVTPQPVESASAPSSSAAISMTVSAPASQPLVSATPTTEAPKDVVSSVPDTFFSPTTPSTVATVQPTVDTSTVPPANVSTPYNTANFQTATKNLGYVYPPSTDQIQAIEKQKTKPPLPSNISTGTSVDQSQFALSIQQQQALQERIKLESLKIESSLLALEKQHLQEQLNAQLQQQLKAHQAAQTKRQTELQQLKEQVLSAMQSYINTQTQKGQTSLKAYKLHSMSDVRRAISECMGRSESQCADREEFCVWHTSHKKNKKNKKKSVTTHKCVFMCSLLSKKMCSKTSSCHYKNNTCAIR